jgi:hypothetical protein
MAMALRPLIAALLGLRITTAFVVAPPRALLPRLRRATADDDAVVPEVIVPTPDNDRRMWERRTRLKGYYREELGAVPAAGAGGDVAPIIDVEMSPAGGAAAVDAAAGGAAAVDAAAVAAAAAPAKKQSLVARIGESGALSYVGINVVWYSVGVNVFLYGMPLATGGGLSLAAKRFGAAWGLCFVASQWSAALRMGLAAALAPTTAKILAALRRRLPSGAPRWVAPVLALAGLVAAFAANAAAALLREVVRVSAVA